MNSFKKFALITLVPIVLIAIVSILISQSFEDVSHFYVNFFMFGFFSIISFCYVYIFEYLQKSKKPKVVSFGYSILALSVAIIIFHCATFYFFFNALPDKNSVFQALLSILIFLAITFAFEIVKQSSAKKPLNVREKPSYFIKLIVKITLIMSTILIVMITDLSIDNFSSQQIQRIIANILATQSIITLVSFGFLTGFYQIMYFRKNIVLGIIIASLLCSGLVYNVIPLLHQKVFMGYPNILVLSFFICFLISATIVYRTKIQNLSLNFINKETEYLQLKNQVNPHFLFNNLNTLIAFIETNPQKAIAFGHQLSNVYRHYLNNEKDDFVSLADEIEFISEYAAIFKAKFESGFTFEVENQASSDQYILSFSLQELMDNIFKHNILDAENPIAIRISIRSDELVVTNTNHKKVVLNSSKKGLQNINKRYQLLTKKEITIKETENFFEVIIPILYITK